MRTIYPLKTQNLRKIATLSKIKSFVNAKHCCNIAQVGGCKPTQDRTINLRKFATLKRGKQNKQGGG